MDRQQQMALFSDMTDLCGDEIPGFEVRYKNQSASSKVLGVLARPFNSAYMTRFTTTRYPRVYFPSEKFVADYPWGAAKILAHEFVHLSDAKSEGFFRHFLGYAFPAWLFAAFWLLYAALVPIFGPSGTWWVGLVLPAALGLAYGFLAAIPGKHERDKHGRLTGDMVYTAGRVVFWIIMGLGLLGMLGLAIWLTTWWAILLGCAVICILPLPAWWRTRIELRGYAMNVAVNYWRYGSVHQSTIDWIVASFTGPNYYFMWPFESQVRRDFADVVDRLELGTLTTINVFGESCRPYKLVYDLLKKNGVVKTVKA